MPIKKELIDTKIKGKFVGQEVATSRLENSLQHNYTEAYKLTTTLGYDGFVHFWKMG